MPRGSDPAFGLLQNPYGQDDHREAVELQPPLDLVRGLVVQHAVPPLLALENQLAG
jgi:hypothetical protein